MEFFLAGLLFQGMLNIKTKPHEAETPREKGSCDRRCEMCGKEGTLSGTEFSCEPLTTFRQQPSPAIPSQPMSEDLKPGQVINGFHPGWVFTLAGPC